MHKKLKKKGLFVALFSVQKPDFELARARGDLAALRVPMDSTSIDVHNAALQ